MTALATGEPAPGIVVAAVGAGAAAGAVLGRAKTRKDGRFELALPAKPELTDAGVLAVVFRLEDDAGRVVLSTAEPLSVAPGRDVRVDFSAPYIEHGAAWPSIRYVGGQPVNVVAASELTRGELLQTYRYLRGRTRRLRRRELVKRAFPKLFERPDSWDDCGEGRLEAIRLLLEERGGAAALADSDADDLPAGATVHWFYTDKIRVKYTTGAAFPNDRVDPTPPAADQAVQLSDGTTIGWVRANLADLHPDNTEVAPAYVQRVGVIAEHALSRYLSAPFAVRDPRNGASRLEYRILQMPAGIAGQTNASWSHVEVGPSNSLIQNLHTVPHELFHQVQYRYNDTTVRSGLYGSVREGGGRLIEESINDQPNRYVDSAQPLFTDPTLSLADSPSVATAAASSTPVRYAAGLFWRYLAEQHSTRTTAADEPAIGVDSYRRVLEAMATVAPGDPGVGYGAAALRTARAGLPWYGSFDQFRYYDAARTELDFHETTWGNYLVANELHGTANPTPDRRFEYMEDDDPVTWPGSGVAKLAALQASVATSDDLSLTQGASITRAVFGHREWAAHYYRLTPGGTPGPRVLRLSFTASGGMTDPLVQILRLGAGGALVDVHRSDRTSYQKTVELAGLSAVVVIVASRSAPGDYTLQLDEVAAASDTMVTRWNSSVGTEYEADPRGWSWTWVSPDVMVDNDDDGLADTTVYFGQNNRLKVRLRNRGNQAASAIEIDFRYQKATPFLSAGAWLPVRDLAGNAQEIAGATLAPGAEQWFSVNWAPVDDGTHHEHWCVKVRVSVPGETNQDNKVALSNLAHVVPSGESDIPFLLRLPESFGLSELHAIPRGPRWLLDIPPSVVRLGRRRKEPACDCNGFALAAPARAVLGRLAALGAELKPWDERVRLAAPQPKRYYPVDPATLPPGVSAENLVTVAQVVDGVAVGGITYEVAPEGRDSRGEG